LDRAVSDSKPKGPLENITSFVPSLLLGGIVEVSTEPNEESIVDYFLSIHGFLIRYFVSKGLPIFVVGLSTMFNSPNAVPATFLSVSRRSEFIHNG
jgi:hypothetical protein